MKETSFHVNALAPFGTTLDPVTSSLAISILDLGTSASSSSIRSLDSRNPILDKSLLIYTELFVMWKWAGIPKFEIVAPPLACWCKVYETFSRHLGLTLAPNFRKGYAFHLP